MERKGADFLCYSQQRGRWLQEVVQTEQSSLDLLPKGLTCPSCECHPSDRDLTETSRAPDQ